MRMNRQIEDIIEEELLSWILVAPIVSRIVLRYDVVAAHFWRVYIIIVRVFLEKFMWSRGRCQRSKFRGQERSWIQGQGQGHKRDLSFFCFALF